MVVIGGRGCQGCVPALTPEAGDRIGAEISARNPTGPPARRDLGDDPIRAPTSRQQRRTGECHPAAGQAASRTGRGGPSLRCGAPRRRTPSRSTAPDRRGRGRTGRRGRSRDAARPGRQAAETSASVPATPSGLGMASAASTSAMTAPRCIPGVGPQRSDGLRSHLAQCASASTAATRSTRSGAQRARSTPSVRQSSASAQAMRSRPNRSVAMHAQPVAATVVPERTSTGRRRSAGRTPELGGGVSGDHPPAGDE